MSSQVATDRPTGPFPTRVGRYELLRRLGAGGMAEVHLARAPGIEGFQKLVVLKRILPQLSADPDFVRMFLAEARLAAILDHPNVVQVFDIGRQASDYYFTMEYVYGADLQSVLRAVAAAGQTLSLEHALAIVLGAASGLHYAHERVGFDGAALGLVHRDVSPTNVMVTYDGCVKVTDFGVAKVSSRTDVTRIGVRKGKVPYMSPEQCRGEPLDRRSDVFALGILLYECTTTTRLFDSDNEFTIMNRIVTGDVPPPSTLQPDYPNVLEEIVMRALSTDRSKRQASAGQLAAELESFAFDQRLRVSQSTLAGFMQELFAPEPFPFGALQGAGIPDVADPDAPDPAATLQAARRESELTPASTPSGRRGSRPGSGPILAADRHDTLRAVTIGLSSLAGLAVVALGVLFGHLYFKGEPDRPTDVGAGALRIAAPFAQAVSESPAASGSLTASAPAAASAPPGTDDHEPHSAPDGGLGGSTPDEAAAGPNPAESLFAPGADADPAGDPSEFVVEAEDDRGTVELLEESDEGEEPRPSPRPTRRRKPRPTKSDATKSDATKPGATKPGATKSGATKPGATKSGATKPGATKPGATTPDLDALLPE